MTGPRKPPPPPGSERRRHPRYEVLAQVEISDTEEATLIVPVRDISAGGISVGLDGDSTSGDTIHLAPGERVTVFLDVGVEKDGRPLHVTLDAEVVRIVDGDKPGAAFRWVFADATVAERFEQVLDYLRKRGVPDAAA